MNRTKRLSQKPTVSQKALSNLIESTSEELFEQLGTRIAFQGRHDVIPLCVDTDALKPMPKDEVRRRLKWSAASFVMLYLGRLSPLKADLTPLLLTVQQIVKQNRTKSIVLVLAGTEQTGYTSHLQQLAKDFGVAANLRLYLAVTDAVKADLLTASDILVSPADSLQESFGLTPIEAMAAGLPQVVADWSGYRETVEDGRTGFLIPTY